MGRHIFSTTITSVNVGQLHAELAGALSALTFEGVADALAARSEIGVDVVEDPTPAQLAQIQSAIDAHVAVDYEARQRQAEQDVAAIPGWATWTADEMVAWIDANVTNLSSAVTVLKAMARMHAAERNKLWPNLEGS